VFFPSMSHALILHIHKSKHRILIGPGGSKIKQLEEKLCVSIVVPKEGDKVTFIGVNFDAATVQDEIEKTVGMKLSSDPLVNCTLSLNFLLHGRLIGKGGVGLAEIREKSGALVEFPPKESPVNTVMLIGTKEAVEKAQKAMEEKLGFKILKIEEVLSEEYVFEKLDLTKDTVCESLFFSGTPLDIQQFNRFIQYLRSATKSLQICVFTLTDDDLKRHLLDLHAKGISIRIITDDSTCTQTGSDILELSRCGIPVRVDNSPALVHHKFAIIDHVCLVNGSFNWTRQAHSSNRENVMITNIKQFVDDFGKEFEKLWIEFEKNPLIKEQVKKE